MHIRPDNVADLALKTEKENWQFRSFLKNSSMPEEEMDKLVAATADRVWAHVDCTQCANCCKQCPPSFTAEEIERLASRLGKTPAAVIEEYLEPQAEEDEEDDEATPHWRPRQLPCPFLQANRCSVYEERPATCRKYPYLHESGFVWRTWGMLERTHTCPIVYEVLEDLKQSMHFDPAKVSPWEGEGEEEPMSEMESAWHDCIDGFVESPRFAALPPAVQKEAGWIVDRLGFCIWQYHFIMPAGITLRIMREALLDFLPMELAGQIGDYGAVPTVVAEFVQYLGETHALPASDKIVTWIRKHSDEVVADGMMEATSPAPARAAAPEVTAPIVREAPKVGRNEPCPCGSGKKYKKCCGGK